MSPATPRALKTRFAAVLGLNRECMKKCGLQKTPMKPNLPGRAGWGSLVKGQNRQELRCGVTVGKKRPLRAAAV